MIKRFIGLFGGFAVVAGILGGFLAITWSYDDLVKDKPLVVCSSLEQLRYFDLQRANYDARINQEDNPILVFGSSELNTYRNRSYTESFWTDHNYGMDIMTVGRGNITDLWDAVAVGAFDKDGIKENKVVLIPGMQWFMKSTSYSKKTLSATYSKSAYDAFLENNKISDDLKMKVSKKLDTNQFAFPTIATPLTTKIFFAYKTVDATASSVASSLRLRYTILITPIDNSGLDTRDAESSRTKNQSVPAARFGTPETPDWNVIQSNALEYAKEQANNNDLYLDNKFYKSRYDKWKEEAQKWKVEENRVFNESEVEDFELLLQVCKECDIKPLVILTPMSDVIYDETQWTSKYRNMYYDMMRETCAEYDVQVADFSNYSANTYFLRDNCHPSDYGWSLMNEQIYRFYIGNE